MKILIVSPLGRRDEWLSTFVGPLEAMGHSVIDEAHHADVAFLSLRWGSKDYGGEVIATIQHRLPVVAFEHLDYVFTGRVEWFEWGLSPNFCNLNTHNTYWNMPWKLALQAVEAAGLLRVYFMRQMQEGQPYPNWVRPLEQALYPNAAHFQLDANLASRPNDLCFVGMSSQCRSTLICHLIESRMFKIDWEWPFRRMDWPAWVDRHRRAKMFLEMNGGAFGSDRPYQLIRIAPMLRQRSSRRWVYDWTGGVNCLDVGNDDGVPQPGDLERLRQLLDDPAALMATYEAGAAYAEEKFSEVARVRYVMETLKEFGIY